MSWRVPWLDHRHVVLPLWLASTSGCYTSEHLSCAQKKPWILASSLLTSPTSLSGTSLLLPFWMHHYICDFEMFHWSFLLHHPHTALTVPLQRKVNDCTQTQLLNPADRRSSGRLLCFRCVWMKSWDFSQHPFTQSKANEATFFAAKVLSLYQCFQRGRVFANGTTSAVSCVTVASDSKPLNYYTLDRGTKEDVELFKVP